jgi:hypothetical protein
MPFVRVFVTEDIAHEQLQRISDAIHESMVTTFQVPAKNRFQVLARHAPGELKKRRCSDAWLPPSRRAASFAPRTS